MGEMTTVRPSPPTLGSARLCSARAATPPGPKSVTVSPRAHFAAEGCASHPVTVGILQCIRKKDFLARRPLASFLIAIGASKTRCSKNIGRGLVRIQFRYNSGGNLPVRTRDQRGRESERRTNGVRPVIDPTVCLVKVFFSRFLVADLYYVDDRVCR